MRYHLSFMALRLDELGHDKNHDIVYSNDSIFVHMCDGFVAWKTNYFYREHEQKPRSNLGRNKI